MFYGRFFPGEAKVLVTVKHTNRKPPIKSGGFEKIR
jgi:hypothetical protein